MSELLIEYIFAALASLIVLTVHEYAHAFAADRLGDPTAKNLGRLTLNPLKHLDPLGALCMVFFHIGWAKPVPINARNLRSPKRDFALTAVAGPLANLLCAFFAAPVCLLLGRWFAHMAFPTAYAATFAGYAFIFMYLFFQINLGIAVFNLLPIPPLDGSRILHLVLPQRLYFKVMRYERTLYFVLLIWLFAGRAVSDFLLRIPFITASPVLTFMATYIVSLSNIIAAAINALSSLILALWQLIPGL